MKEGTWDDGFRERTYTFVWRNYGEKDAEFNRYFSIIKSMVEYYLREFDQSELLASELRLNQYQLDNLNSLFQINENFDISCTQLTCIICRVRLFCIKTVFV